ncbi:MAG: orotate phosphoribosyltransferase [Coriobacteriales bacterium]|jgi:orotate phosphoribosyltransferase|nr:orotate phosphoribosyltransferase [Coriobacteriales bacterium]
MDTARTGRMDDNEIHAQLVQSEALRSGHFRLTSGRHSDSYIQCARVLENPRLTARLAAETVARLPEGHVTDLVIAPAVGGILFGFAVADVLDVPFLFTERKDGVMQLRRSFVVPPGASVLVAEDVVTTGGSVAEVCNIVEEAGATVAGVVSLIHRGSTPVFDAPFYPLLSLNVPSWEPDDCALCREGVPIDAPGSRSN